MKPSAFEYVRPKTLAEAFASLAHPDAKIIAGGQSLVPMMNFRLVTPERLVDVTHITELRGISETADAVTIGALTRHSEALSSPLLATVLPVIGEALAHVAHLAIRNRGTIGGSLCHADPSAEWPLLVTLLDARIVLTSVNGSREAAADEFFIAPLVTGLEDGEIVTSIVFAKPAMGSGMAFDEVSQRAGDFAIVSCGAVIRVEDGTIAEARLALGGMADAPLRLAGIEGECVGKPADIGAIASVIAQAADGLEPNDDMHASAEYRRHLAPVLTRRVMARALERAKGTP